MLSHPCCIVKVVQPLFGASFCNPCHYRASFVIITDPDNEIGVSAASSSVASYITPGASRKLWVSKQYISSPISQRISPQTFKTHASWSRSHPVQLSCSRRHSRRLKSIIINHGRPSNWWYGQDLPPSCDPPARCEDPIPPGVPQCRLGSS